MKITLPDYWLLTPIFIGDSKATNKKAGFYHNPAIKDPNSQIPT